jgi:hypothetical protein
MPLYTVDCRSCGAEKELLVSAVQLTRVRILLETGSYRCGCGEPMERRKVERTGRARVVGSKNRHHHRLSSGTRSSAWDNESG